MESVKCEIVLSKAFSTNSRMKYEYSSFVSLLLLLFRFLLVMLLLLLPVLRKKLQASSLRSMLPPSPTCPCSHRFHIPVSRILNKISYDLAVAVAYRI